MQNSAFYRDSVLSLAFISIIFLTPLSAYAQDIALPPLPADPSGNLDSAALPPIAERPAQSVPETALPNVTDVNTAEIKQKINDSAQVLSTRASEADIDDLLPKSQRPDVATAASAQQQASQQAESAVDASAKANTPASSDTASAASDKTAIPASQSPADAEENTSKNSVVATESKGIDKALEGLPALPDPLATNEIKPPPTLEEEAAAAGFIRPDAKESLPDLSAQALLSGQPMSPDEEEEDLTQHAPKEKIKKKLSLRDLPRLRPVIEPLRHSFNYRRTTLPPSIYRKQYSADNQHLPKAVTREDYDRALFYTVAANDINGTRAFLERGADINMVNADGDTLLITAIRYRAIDTARLLLARGANPNLQGSGGITAMQYAIASGQNTLAVLLRARGAA